MSHIIFSTKKDMTSQAIKEIKKFRKLRGWSQKELAEKLGISQARVAYIESGKGSITLTTLQEILSL